MENVIVISIVSGALLGAAALYIMALFRRIRDLQRQAERSARIAALLKQENDDHDAVEAGLRDRESWLLTIFNNTKDMVFVHDMAGDLPGRFQEINDAGCAALKRTRKELLKMTPLDVESLDMPLSTPGITRSDMVVLPDEYIDRQRTSFAAQTARRRMEQILRNGHARYQCILADRDGGTIPVEVDAHRFDVKNRTMIICTATDITEREEAEQKISASRKQFHDFFTQSPIGIAVYGPQRNLLDVNRACLRAFGIPDAVAFEKIDFFAGPFVPPEVQAKLARGESVRFEAMVDFDDILQHGVFVTTRTGKGHYDTLVNNMGPDRNFEPRGYIVQVVDITERRHAEKHLRESEQQLRQSEKMEAIGSMAGGIAHDFNNILTPIIGYAQILRRKCQDDSDIQKCAQSILRAGQRAKELVGEILTFSRRSENADELHPIHVIPIAKEVLKLQEASLPKNVTVNRIIKAESDTVKANPSKLHQVLMNLCTNAGHAMKEAGGMLEMRITDFVLTKKQAIDFPELEPGRYLRLSIKDTGTGMDKATLDRIFEPFFTTKPSGEGTGMGLAVVHGIVKSLNGALRVDTELGTGSIFHAILPLVDVAAAEEAAPAAGALPEGRERILFVDDDPDVREMANDMLKSLGYDVVTAGHGQGALRLLTLDPNHFDIVLTDQVMPGMTGLELAAQIRAIRSDIPIIMCSGFKQTSTAEEADTLGITELLVKPLSLDDLAQTLRRVLDARNSDSNA